MDQRNDFTGSSKIDVSGLLTIDVASELRKLSQAQLQGPWQIPAELVRRALRDGARQVSVKSGRGRFEVRDDGRGLPSSELQWTAVLLDGGRSNGDRHSALTELERSGALALLAVAGLPPRSVRVSTTRSGVRTTLSCEFGRTPQVTSERVTESDSTRIVINSPEIERRRAIEWLSGAARFADAAVTLDGKPAGAGFVDTFAPTALEAPLRGSMALPVRGETAHAWLLEHGLVTGHVAIPDSPCFEAAVELGSDTTELSAARLRERMEPNVSTLVDQAVRHVIQTGMSAPGLPEPARARIARLVLGAARKGLRPEGVWRVPAFRVVDAEGERCVSLEMLQTAAGPDRTLPTLEPKQRPEQFAIGLTAVVVAEEGERSLLAEVLDLRFRPPEARDESGWAASLWRRTASSLGRSLASVAELVRHPVRPRLIEDDELTHGERNLLEAMRQHALGGRHGVGDVSFCRGTDRPRRRPGNPARLLLPRDNAMVRACVDALQTDPRWIYPVWLALLDGHASAPRGLRGHWVARV